MTSETLTKEDRKKLRELGWTIRTTPVKPPTDERVASKHILVVEESVADQLLELEDEA